MADGHGGRRAGSGRKVLEATKFREALIRKIEERADGLADALLDKALSGDVPALREVADRGLGKSRQTLGFDSEDGLESIVLNFMKPNDGSNGGES